MKRSERRLLIDTSILGLLLTLVFTALDYTGMLAAPEQFFYDLRARHCQYFTPPPTDKLVHLDIDDRSLEVIGRWPWSRDKIAEIIDEIRLAGAKTLAMDIIFSEPEPVGYEELYSLDSPAATTTAPATRPAPFAQTGLVAARRVDHDAIFAESLRRFGRAVVPVSLNLSLTQSTSPLRQALVGELIKDIERSPAELVPPLQAQGFHDAGLERQIEAIFTDARREAMYGRIERECRGGSPTAAELRGRILPKTDPAIAGSVLLRLLDAEYGRYQNVRSLQRFARPIDPNLPVLIGTSDEQSTLKPFADAAGSSGFVDYMPYGDGIVRTVPLWANHRGFAFPQMGLAMACAMLGIKPADLILERDRIIIPCPDGRKINIPVRIANTSRGEVGMIFDIPWFGKSGAGQWETMYDYPAHIRPRQHLPVHYIWAACELRHRIARNIAMMDDAVVFLLSFTRSDGEAAQYIAHRPPPDDLNARSAMADDLLKRGKELLDFLGQADPATFASEDRLKFEKLKAAVPNLQKLLAETAGLQRNLDQRRRELKDQLSGRAMLIGYTAVGAIADFVPTSLHPRCPGVVVHGVIFNSIMTGRFWHVAPSWVTAGITLLAGLLTTLIIARLTAWKALAAAAVLAMGYLLFNGLYLFDKHHLLVGVAGPLSCIGVVWAGGTLTRYILEASERARAEKYFRNYVDPALVDYVLGSENAKLDGQLKELTVVFTDLADFTSHSEQLRERSVQLLNRYMGTMVPIIRRNQGYLNKLLGDGMMFFFAAPIENPTHAVDAVRTAVEIQDAMIEFNQSISDQGLPPMTTRIGISSGHMVVGNCGPADRTFSDYTVLGDTVNLGSRLEGANKAFGSRTLLNERVYTLAADHFLFRPIGRLQVKGKREGVMTYEALARVESATDRQKKLAELTAAIVTPFLAGDFGKCLQAIERMEQAFGPDKLTALYRDLCAQYLRQPPPSGFDGQIVLTEK